MSRSIVFGVIGGSLLALGLGASAYAQSALSSCNAATGRTPSGQQCFELSPTDPTQINVPQNAAAVQQYGVLETGSLAQTYQCNPGGGSNAVGSGGVALIENCGAPLSPAELGQTELFYGTQTAVAPPPPPPAPAYVPPPAAPVVQTITQTVPVAVAQAPAVAAPVVSGLGGIGLGGAGLLAAGLGAAAIVGIIALTDGDGDDATVSTVSTPGT